MDHQITIEPPLELIGMSHWWAATNGCARASPHGWNSSALRPVVPMRREATSERDATGDFDVAISWYLVVIGVDFRLWWFISWSLWIVLVIGIVIHSVIYAYFVGTKKTRRTPQLAIDIPTSVWIGQNVTVWILYKWTYINGILFIVGFDYKRVWTWCVFD